MPARKALFGTAPVEWYPLKAPAKRAAGCRKKPENVRRNGTLCEFAAECAFNIMPTAALFSLASQAS